jgi:hypothetical protein
MIDITRSERVVYSAASGEQQLRTAATVMLTVLWLPSCFTASAATTADSLVKCTLKLVCSESI